MSKRLTQAEIEGLVTGFKTKIREIASKYELELDENQVQALYEAYLFGNETMLHVLTKAKNE